MALPGSSSSSASAPSSMASRELLLHRAKIAQIAGRSEDAVNAMHAISELCVDLTQEEHNLLVSTYSEYVHPGHSSLATLLSIEVEENNAAFLEETKACRKSIQSELGNFYTSAIDHLKKYLIPSSIGAENCVFYHKLVGDFCWLLGKMQPGNERKLSFGNSLKAYEIAEEQAESNLPPANRTRLLVAFKHSMFHSYMAGCERSSEIAKAALGQALVGIDTLGQDLCSDSKVLLELLKEIMTISSVDFAIKSGVNELVNESQGSTCVQFSRGTSGTVQCCGKMFFDTI